MGKINPKIEDLIPPRKATWWLGHTDIKQALLDGERQDLFLIKDIAVHGCEGGVPDLTYYVDTTAFFDCFEHDVWKYVRESAEAVGSSVFELLDKDIAGPTAFKNSMTWLAVECAAQELEAAKETH
jgi:hypothetical protein